MARVGWFAIEDLEQYPAETVNVGLYVRNTQPVPLYLFGCQISRRPDDHPHCVIGNLCFRAYRRQGGMAAYYKNLLKLWCPEDIPRMQFKVKETIRMEISNSFAHIEKVTN